MPFPSGRRVSFSARNDYSRLPHDDELYVMRAFARHAARCSSCADPHRTYRQGSTLCPKGHQRALDVAQYVYNKGGNAYSLVDSERNQRVQIEIPSNCDVIRSLLKAMERGLRVMKRAPPSSYDRTYYVPARRASDRDAPVRGFSPPASTRKLQLETVEPPRSPRPRHSHSRSYSSRSPSPQQRQGLSRYGSTATTKTPYASAPVPVPMPHISSSFQRPRDQTTRNGSYSSMSSARDNSPFSSRNNSISSQSSYGSYNNPNNPSAPNSRKASLSRLFTTSSSRDRARSSTPPRSSRSRDRSAYPEISRPMTFYRRRGSSASSPERVYVRRDSGDRGRRGAGPAVTSADGPERYARKPSNSSPSRDEGDGRSYKVPIIYRIKREPSPTSALGTGTMTAAPIVPPKDEYAYTRRR